MTGAIVVFGAGYGLESLSCAAWLLRCRLHYWGDIETHGFSILDRLRSDFPHADSFLMDHGTLLAHRAQWGEEPVPARQDLARLTADEAEVYDALRYDRLQPRLRLEQERLAQRWIVERIARIAAA